MRHHHILPLPLGYLDATSQHRVLVRRGRDYVTVTLAYSLPRYLFRNSYAIYANPPA